jgi:hypothetical protein
MSLSAGAKLGLHEIVASNGAGRMAEVYGGRLQQLACEVAVTVLPERVARHPERLPGSRQTGSQSRVGPTATASLLGSKR